MHQSHTLQQVIEQMPAAMAIFDCEQRYRAVSRRYLSNLAWVFSTELLAPNKVIGRTFFEVSPEAPPRWKDGFARVLAGEEEQLAQEEDFVPRPDSRAVWFRWAAKPWRDVHGRIVGVLLFAEMVTEEVEIWHALAESESQARATFENAAVGIGHLSSNLRWLRANDALCRIIGWPIKELVAKSLQDITHPDDLEAELAHVEQMRDGKIDNFDMEKRYLHKDGRYVWTRLTVSCVRKSDGPIDYFLGVIQDISTRKRAQEQVHLLMREANHRVKNLLGLVQVIARQTAAVNPEDFVTGNPEYFIRRFTQHIQALAANQDLLGRNQHQGVDLEDLIRTHLAHFADLVGSRITALGPKLRLNTAAAQAIGLALHELATNAGKYGALSTNMGRVDIGWAMTDDSFTMSWTERNGPPVRPPERKGFGGTVIDSMVKRTVGGEVQLDYAFSGLGWRLTCPVANALEGTAKPASKSSNAPRLAKPSPRLKSRRSSQGGDRLARGRGGAGAA
jgi:PAS domain S-box-containing protein